VCEGEKDRERDKDREIERERERERERKERDRERECVCICVLVPKATHIQIGVYSRAYTLKMSLHAQIMCIAYTLRMGNGLHQHVARSVGKS